MAQQKIRLDHYLVQHCHIESEEVAQSLVMTGQVIVNNEKITKPGTLIKEGATVRVLSHPSLYVSRGGEKCRGAHEAFGFSIAGRVALDIGISTGGFTDYLRQHGADLVFGVDVGYGQVAMKLQQDPNVVVLERVNARYLTQDTFEKLVAKQAPEHVSALSKIDLLVMDVSFISVRQILPVVKPYLSENTDYIVLIKPQFESNPDEIGPGGIIRDDSMRDAIFARVEADLNEKGFELKKKIMSPIQGAKGNQEAFFWLRNSDKMV